MLEAVENGFPRPTLMLAHVIANPLGGKSRMSLLQDPLKTLDQIEWYLQNSATEKFPGAFLIAAGNLSRHLLEQVLFILAFYGGLPTSKYMRPDKTLRTAGNILQALKQKNPLTGRTYLEQARRRSPRIRKFARFTRSLDRWRTLLNEPSHFRNPAALRLTRESHIRHFLNQLRATCDSLDAHLVTAAVNELRSRGRFRAILANDPENSPGIAYQAVVGPQHLYSDEGRLSLRTPQIRLRIIPDTHEVPHRWPMVPVILQHSVGMVLQAQLITRHGTPIDLSTGETILRSLASSQEDRRRLERRLRKLGFTVRYHRR